MPMPSGNISLMSFPRRSITQSPNHPITSRFVSAGFTLPEIMITALIFSVILGALLVSFLVGRSSYLSADAYIHVQQETRRALDTMVRELREAGGTINAGVPGQLDFQVALGYNLTGVVGCPANAVCWGAVDEGGTNQPTHDWSLRYRVNGTQLIREIFNGPNPSTAAVRPGTRVLANDVNAANTTFSYDAPNKAMTVRIEVKQTSQQLPGGSMGTTPSPLRTQVKLRNS